MKIEAAKRNSIFNKKTIIIVLILLCLIVISLFVYQSYATWKITNTHNAINAKVAEFEKSFAYTGAAQTYVVPKTGYYQIELWGAGGGISGSASTSGSYTKGSIFLEESATLYFYVGGQGASKVLAGTATRAGGFNGGGIGGAGSWNYSNCGTGTGGGGSTDVRIVSGSWNNTTSLRSRIMVASGGGGVGRNVRNTNHGGILFSEMNNSFVTVYVGSDGGPATQISSGAGGAVASDQSAKGNNGVAGSFGIGGGGVYGYCDGSGGGGGGYYGGASGGSAGNGAGGNGSGGSSFISGFGGVNAINSTGTHNYQTLHYSNNYFTNGKMQKLTTNRTNGKATIRFIGNTEPQRINEKLNKVKYIKDCINGSSANTASHWVELQAIKDGVNLARTGTITPTVSGQANLALFIDGNAASSTYSSTSTTGLQCLTVELTEQVDLDEITVWHYWQDARKYKDNYLAVSSNNSDWIELHNYSGLAYTETNGGRRYNAWNLSAIE